ncbi:MAG: hypothetical protein ACFCVF_12330 [Kineosporiaceae bacterium]
MADDVPPELLRCPFPTRRALARVARHELESSGRYRRVGYGAWMVADEGDSYGRRIQGVLSRQRQQPVLLGPSAAWAHGCRHADPHEHVHVAGRARTGRDLVRHPTALDPGDVVATPMGPATSLERTAVDLARGIGTAHLDHLGRVTWVDALLRATGLVAVRARSGLIPAAGLRGLDQARLVLRAARDGVDSPKETELRLLVVGAGFPEPQTQCPVVLGGRIVARLDLGWPDHRAGLEYDGAVHLERRQHSWDLDRHNAIRAACWRVLQADQRLLDRPADLLARLALVVPRS